MYVRTSPKSLMISATRPAGSICTPLLYVLNASLRRVQYALYVPRLSRGSFRFSTCSCEVRRTKKVRTEQKGVRIDMSGVCTKYELLYASGFTLPLNLTSDSTQDLPGRLLIRSLLALSPLDSIHITLDKIHRLGIIVHMSRSLPRRRLLFSSSFQR